MFPRSNGNVMVGGGNTRRAFRVSQFVLWIMYRPIMLDRPIDHDDEDDGDGDGGNGCVTTKPYTRTQMATQ